MGLQRDPEATKSDPKGSSKGIKNKDRQKNAKRTPKGIQNGPFLDPKSTLGSLWGALGMPGVRWGCFGTALGGFGALRRPSSTLVFVGGTLRTVSSSLAPFLLVVSLRSPPRRPSAVAAAAAAVRRHGGRRRRPPRAAKTVVKRQLHKSRI